MALTRAVRVRISCIVNALLVATGLHLDRTVENNLRKSEDPSPDRKTGSILSFVPAHGDSKAGAVAQQLSRTLAEGPGVAVLLADFRRGGYPLWRPNETPRRLDGHTWGALVTERDGLEVLNASEVHPRQLGPLFQYARQSYNLISADLTDARAAQAIEVLRASDSIFMVSGSARASLEAVQEKMVWLRSINLEDRCGLLLAPDPGGLSALEAEQLTDLPVCSLIETHAQIVKLGHWLMANLGPAEEASAGLAMAG